MITYQLGFEYVYAYIEPTDDVSLYQTCLSWCEAEKVYHVKDLVSRIVSPCEHQRIWIDRCQEYLKNNRKGQ